MFYYNTDVNPSPALPIFAKWRGRKAGVNREAITRKIRGDGNQRRNQHTGRHGARDACASRAQRLKVWIALLKVGGAFIET